MKMKNARDFQVIGKYLENTQRVFTAHEILHIKRAIGRGVTIKRLSQHYNVDYRVISQIFTEFMWSTQETILIASPKRLGHKDVNITLNTYSHVLPNMQEDAAKRLFEAYKNISK
jgi:hypothetical protein